MIFILNTFLNNHMLNKKVLLVSLYISFMICYGAADNIKKYFYCCKTSVTHVSGDKSNFIFL